MGLLISRIVSHIANSNIAINPFTQKGTKSMLPMRVRLSYKLVIREWIPLNRFSVVNTGLEIINPFRTSPKYTWTGVYGKCMLQRNKIAFNGLQFHDENLLFGQFIPQFRKSDFFPLTCQSITCGLGERPINPQADTHQLFVDHDWWKRTIREQFIMLLRNTTAAVLITLGFMTLGVWHKRDSGTAGGKKLGGFSQTRERAESN